MNNLKFFLPACIVCCFLISGCDGCNKIKLPREDQTPPSGKWTVDVLDADKQFELPAGTVTMTNLYSVRIYFTVNDNDGGIKRIKVSGSGTKAYPQMMHSYDWGPQNQLSWNEAANFSPDANGMVEKSAFLIKQFDFTPQPGNASPGDIRLQVIIPAGGRLDLTGIGENFHGGTFTSHLTITATPKK